jgi:hypothetical protein
MKVKELRELMRELDDDADVQFSMDDGCCGDYLTLELAFSDAILAGLMELRFKAVPGYRSCIQSGATKQADKDYWNRINGTIDK